MNKLTLVKFSLPVLVLTLALINIVPISQAVGAYKSVSVGKHISSLSNLWLSSSATVYFTSIVRDANFIEFYSVSTGGYGISQVGIDPKTTNVTLTSISPLEIKYTQDGIGIVRVYVPSMGTPVVYSAPIISSSTYDDATHILTVTTIAAGVDVTIQWANTPTTTIPTTYYINQTVQVLSTFYVIIALIGGVMILDKPESWSQVVGFAIGIAIIITIATFLGSLGF